MVSEAKARAIWRVHFSMLHGLPEAVTDKLLDALTDAELVEFCRQDQRNDAATDRGGDRGDPTELAIARGYVVASIPPGADAVNDYWRLRVRVLEAGR